MSEAQSLNRKLISDKKWSDADTISWTNLADDSRWIAESSNRVDPSTRSSASTENLIGVPNLGSIWKRESHLPLIGIIYPQRRGEGTTVPIATDIEDLLLDITNHRGIQALSYYQSIHQSILSQGSINNKEDILQKLDNLQIIFGAAKKRYHRDSLVYTIYDDQFRRE